MLCLCISGVMSLYIRCYVAVYQVLCLYISGVMSVHFRCYDCDDEVQIDCNKKLVEAVEFVKKMAGLAPTIPQGKPFPLSTFGV